MNNFITVIDYAEQGSSVYITLEVFDAEQNKLFAEEVRFLGDLLYGDLIHIEKSPLTEKCRQETVDYLKNYFSR